MLTCTFIVETLGNFHLAQLHLVGGMGFAEKQTVGVSRRAVSRASVFALSVHSIMGASVPRLRRLGQVSHACYFFAFNNKMSVTDVKCLSSVCDNDAGLVGHVL